MAAPAASIPSSAEATQAQVTATSESSPYVPPQCQGLPVATLPAAAAIGAPADTLPANPPLTIEQQLGVLREVVDAVSDHYLYPEAVNATWLDGVAGIQARIQAGLDTEVFYGEMQSLVHSLGDEHSDFQTPQDIAAEAAEITGTYEFAGIGVILQSTDDEDWATVIGVFEGTPAWYAGIQQHDTLLAVDGGPIRDGSGTSRARGPECTAVVLTIRTPGQPSRDMTVVRSRVSAPMPVHPRLVPTSDGSRVGYIFIPTLADEAIPETVRGALEGLGPLDGLILDNRMNGGGLGPTAKRILELFTSGYVGDYVSRSEENAWELDADPVHNSQDVPLVVLVGEDTVSYGEIVSGVLQDIGRAVLVGQTTLGNVEFLRAYDFQDGSRTWLASERFVPVNSQADWEATGIVPDVEVIAAWDTYTFETDPAIAAALALLGH